MTIRKMDHIILLEIFFLIIGCCLRSTFAFDPSENELDSHEPRLISPVDNFSNEVDLLKLLNVSLEGKDPGLALVEGPYKDHLAYKFSTSYENNGPINNSSGVQEAMNGIFGFSVLFLYRQQRNNVGTLLSINAPGRLTPYFQIGSNTRTGQITFKLKQGKTMTQLQWKRPKRSSWTWLLVNVNIPRGIVRLDLNCKPSRFDALFPKKSRRTTPTVSREDEQIPRDSLIYFRQEPGMKNKFFGTIQVAKIIPYVPEHRMWTCLETGPKSVPVVQKTML